MAEKAEKRFGHDEIERLGEKLDRFANDLSDDERDLLATVIEIAGQRGAADPNLSLSDRLHRVRGSLDVGAFNAMV
ncbi:MAG TPA: hypothetical protein VE596_07680 [Gaiellaceae bacterium]|nr:hypothetical protein [Gaiellaceae bacterium]